MPEDLTPPEPITIDGPDGRRHRLRYDAYRLPGGEILVELGEGDFGRGYNASTGYHFGAAGPADGSRFAEQVQQVTTAAREAIAKLYLEEFDAGWEGKRPMVHGMEVRGRLIWSGSQDREPYAVVVDGRAMSWDQFGRTLEPFEGYNFRLSIEEVIEDMTRGSDPDLDYSEPLPPFAELFPGRPMPSDEAGGAVGDEAPILTPRNAALLWECALAAAQDAEQDIAAFGDRPVPSEESLQRAWMIFADYPPITYGQDSAWRRRARHAFLDLAADLEDGRPPLPRSPAEELALHLMLNAAQQGRSSPHEEQRLMGALPISAEDDDWDYLREVLFRDHDILTLYDRAAAGIENPDDPRNQMMSIGDYRPPAWFTTFRGFSPRVTRSAPPV